MFMPILPKSARWHRFRRAENAIHVLEALKETALVVSMLNDSIFSPYKCILVIYLSTNGMPM